MKLYHGTRAQVGRLALTEGLKPRRETRRQNWAHSSPSHPDGVYLTDAYPLYFGVQCLEVSALRTEAHDKLICAVVEVETDRLNPFQLVPDEDVLEQLGRANDTYPERWTMRQRTLAYRNRLDHYTGEDQWRKSLQVMGTCAHLGPIPPAAVTRVALIHVKDQAPLVWQSMQPLISVLNYRFCAEKYRALTAQIWDGGPGIEIMENTPCPTFSHR